MSKENRAVGDIIKDITHFHIPTIKIKGLKVTRNQAKSILKNNFKDHNRLGVYYLKLNHDSMGYYHIGGKS